MVELLAPAGDMQCLKAAIHAGADAVYVGGSRFGARAYAHNFDEQELSDAIDYVHLFGKKLYLTLNTLLKDEEIQDVPSYVKPFYETGLDGVIVQDFGVVKVLKEHFPDMEIHASTQMTVTGPEAALQLKEQGICRVVPARELSLKEIREIYDATGMEIETFVHGAMCYSYSGQCLFSSFLGGRSGNRGRCAGPCRLPYDILDETGRNVNTEKEQYPLSLKDLGTLEILPELIEAGIASFKIEGRMKSPEYVAGVTSIYRKYIDLYREKKETFRIEEKDINHLRNLYTRGSMETGYYKRHNGREMVTLSKGSYENSVSDYTDEIKARYVDVDKKVSICGQASFRIGEPGNLQLWLAGASCEKKPMVVVYTSVEVMAAQNRPMEEGDLRRQLVKTGNSHYVFEQLNIEKEQDLFIPNKELNELRRNGLEQLEEFLLDKYHRLYKESQIDYGEIEQIEAEQTEIEQTEIEQKEIEQKETEQKETEQTGRLSVSVSTKEQFLAVVESDIVNVLKKIYFPYRLFLQLYHEEYEKLMKCKAAGTLYYMSFPPIIRSREKRGMEEALNCKHSKEILTWVDGFLVNNLEGLGFVKGFLSKHKKNMDIQSDYGLYTFNKEACEFLEKMDVKHRTAPFEWSKHELKNFSKQKESFVTELILYGYIPLMESANCIYKTMKRCKLQKGDTSFVLKDRYKTNFQVMTDCLDCRNTIFNSVPLSLHKEWAYIRTFENLNYRLNFTMENDEETRQVLEQFGMLLFDENDKNDKKVPSKVNEKGFTTGHFRKGVL